MFKNLIVRAMLRGSGYLQLLLKFDKDLIKSMKHQSIIGVY